MLLPHQFQDLLVQATQKVDAGDATGARALLAPHAGDFAGSLFASQYQFLTDKINAMLPPPPAGPPASSLKDGFTRMYLGIGALAAFGLWLWLRRRKKAR